MFIWTTASSTLSLTNKGHYYTTRKVLPSLQIFLHLGAAHVGDFPKTFMSRTHMNQQATQVFRDKLNMSRIGQIGWGGSAGAAECHIGQESWQTVRAYIPMFSNRNIVGTFNVKCSYVSIEVPVSTSVSPLEDLYKRCSVSTSSCTESSYFESSFYCLLCLSHTYNVYSLSLSVYT